MIGSLASTSTDPRSIDTKSGSLKAAGSMLEGDDDDAAAATDEEDDEEDEADGG